MGTSWWFVVSGTEYIHSTIGSKAQPQRSSCRYDTSTPRLAFNLVKLWRLYGVLEGSATSIMYLSVRKNWSTLQLESMNVCIGAFQVCKVLHDAYERVVMRYKCTALIVATVLALLC